MKLTEDMITQARLNCSAQFELECVSLGKIEDLRLALKVRTGSEPHSIVFGGKVCSTSSKYTKPDLHHYLKHANMFYNMFVYKDPHGVFGVDHDEIMLIGGNNSTPKSAIVSIVEKVVS